MATALTTFMSEKSREDWTRYWARRRYLAKHYQQIAINMAHPEIAMDIVKALAKTQQEAEDELIAMGLAKELWDDRDRWFGNEGIDCCTGRLGAAPQKTSRVNLNSGGFPPFFIAKKSATNCIFYLTIQWARVIF